MTAQEIIELLKLKPHPKEGGFFSETYRAEEAIPLSVLPPRYAGPRAFDTCIYYLLTPPADAADLLRNAPAAERRDFSFLPR